MRGLNLVFVNSLSPEKIITIDDLLNNERIRKYLWIEFILNPEMVRTIKSHIDNPIVREAITDALSWYLAFRWILPDNRELEGLYKKGTIEPYRVKLQVYKEKRRNFLKGLIHAGLC
ncbi:MAG: hypothetical protein Fur0020_13820 [Thermodesulfovibrionia bacterium]